MKHLSAVLLCLLLPMCAFGQSVKLPAEIKAQPGMIIVPCETDCPTVLWVTTPGSGLQVIPSDLLKNSKTAVCFATAPGRYPLQAIVAKGDVPAYAVTVIVVGDAPPVPPGPNPPIPPTPVPDGTSPFKEAGLRVLIVFETTDEIKLTAGQRSIIYGQPIRDLFNAKCVVGPDGKTKEWRILDQNASMTNMAKTWQDAMARPRKSVPWLLIGNGRTGYEGPLPDKAEDMAALINKYSAGSKP